MAVGILFSNGSDWYKLRDRILAVCDMSVFCFVKLYERETCECHLYYHCVIPTCNIYHTLVKVKVKLSLCFN
jgi:hypothetical protein